MEFVTDVLYVDDDGVTTSAGSAAGIDAGLHLIRQDFGAAVANQVARRLVMPSHREGGQRQLIPKPVLSRRYGKFDQVLDWARTQLGTRISGRDMACAASMGERNFYRRFREATGQAPVDWLLKERLKQARELLESTDQPLTSIAQAVGFSSVETFRAAFRLMGIPPTAYRRNFRRA